MQVKPVSGPLAVPQTGVNPSAQAEAKARAIAKLTSQQPVPLENPSNISPEELGAVRQASPKPSIQQPKEASVEANTASETVSDDAPANQTQEDKLLASRFAQLAKREKAMRAKIQQQEQAFAKREAELKAKEEALGQQPKFDPKEYIPRSRLKENAYGILSEEGISYDDLTQQALQAQQAKNPLYDAKIQQLEATINELRQGFEKTNKSYEEAQQTQYKSAIEQIRKDVSSLVKEDPNYETVKATGSINDVVDLIEKTYNEEGRLMTVEEAAEEVENYLIEEAMKLTRIQKIQKKLNISSNTQKVSAGEGSQQTKPQSNTQPQQVKTLTNAIGSTGQLSAKARAIAAFEGRLKS